MTAVGSDEARMLRDSAATFCATEFPMDQVRRMADGPGGITPAAWQALAAQGWLAILIPESQGGLGLGITELAMVLEQLGRALVPGPFLSAAALGVPAIAASPNGALRARWLEPISSGAKRVTLALLEDARLPADDALAVRAEPTGSSRYRLTGTKRLVPDLAGADAIAVVTGTGTGPRIFLVDAEAPGVTVEENRVVDATSRYGTLDLASVEVSDDHLLGDGELLARLLAFANVGIAAMAVGGARAVFDQVTSYVKQRTQFGVPIGTFQAVQHPLADLFGEIESAESAYRYAAWAVDHRGDDLPQAVALARLASTAAYRKAGTTSLQAHGGIAFTWEYDLHLHLKRALHLCWLLGGPADYEEIIARNALEI